MRGGRKSKIWRVDLSGQRLETVESQCSEPYFYSRPDATRVEAELGRLETAYGQITSKFWLGENPGNLGEYFCLLVMMIDLHLRSRRYRTGPEENYGHYLRRYSVLRTGILFQQRTDPAEDPEVEKLFKDHWRVRIVQAGDGRCLLTSDNPCVWFNASDEFGDAHLMLMPVTPFAYAVAYDNRVFEFTSGMATEEDEVAFTQVQGRQAVEALFTHEQLTVGQLKGAHLLLRQSKTPVEVLPDGSWMPDILQFPEATPFRFVRRVPTL
jgi:hypothetical protein